MELAMQSPTVVEGVGILGQQVRGLSSCFQAVLAPHGWRAGTWLVWRTRKAWRFASWQHGCSLAGLGHEL